MYDKDSQFLCHLQTPFGPDGFKTSVKMPKRTNSVLIWSLKKSPRPWVIDIGSGGKDTGPIRPGKIGGDCWGCIIYNWTAKKLVMTSVTIEYMDGTELKISEKEIKYIR